MEWVETTAKSLEEAKDLALDKLGVDDSDAEFEVIEEPRQGLFGRTRGQARVRARIAPKAPRAKEERGRNRKRRGRGEGGGNKGGANNKSGNRSEGNRSEGNRSEDGRSEGGRSEGGRSEGGRSKQGGNKTDGGRSRSGGQREKKQSNRQESKVPDASIEEVNASVEKFLTGLTDAFGYDSPVEIDLSNDEVSAQIAGKHGLLLGPKARTLDAIQELTRITAQRQAPSGIRIKVDVGGYRERRREALGEFATTAAQTAIDDGVEVVLEPMSPPDRKVVHDALNEVDGVSTRSAGQEPRRRVIIVPDETTDDAGADDSADEPVENEVAENEVVEEEATEVEAGESDETEATDSADAEEPSADD